jgi:predicted amino acid dehydrogenase
MLISPNRTPAKSLRSKACRASQAMVFEVFEGVQYLILSTSGLCRFPSLQCGRSMGGNQPNPDVLVKNNYLEKELIFYVICSLLHHKQEENVMTDRSALITGASGDIGRTIALSYARNGFNLKLTGRDPMRLNESAKMVRSLGQSADILTADLTDMNSTDALSSWASEDKTLSAVVFSGRRR